MPLDADQPRLYRMLFRLQVLAAVGCGLVLLYCCHAPWPAALRVAAVGISVAGGAGLLGFLFGFIFCYPRIQRKGDGAAAPQPGVAVEDNSSLADISDWLTKIIVGVGLVELNRIPPALYHLAGTLAPGLQPGTGSVPAGGQVFALALILYFFPLGFIFGFLWTRFYYQEALKGLLSTIRDLQQNKDASNLADLADAKLDENRPDLASSSAEQALRLDPNNPKALFVKARVLKRQAYSTESKTYDRTLLEQALQLATRAAQLLPHRASPLYNMACYLALLQKPLPEVISTLRQALEINPALASNAERDPDFEQARAQGPDFSNLLAEFKTRAVPPRPPQEGNPPGNTTATPGIQ